MAEIFLARERDGDGSVLVIKRVLPHLADEARFVAMFRDEARLAARIEHDNVCRVLDFGSVGDTYFIALEYLHGMPLSRVMVRASRSGRPLDIRLAAGLLVQCCAGLHHAHELLSEDGRSLDVVHRDISPPNIFVTASGEVKLLDFGVAKARGASDKTRTGTVKGKNAYMSPEQVRGQRLDRRSDLFSLGIVLWESVTAQRLFLREVDFETFRSITQGDVPDIRSMRPDAPAELAEVVHRALALRPEDRFATALELGDAVAAAVAGIGGPAGERQIAGHIRKQFTSELRARQQLLDVTAMSARPSEEAPSSADGSTPPPPRKVVDAMAEQPVDIHWTAARKSHPMSRVSAVTTAPIPRLDGEVPPVPSTTRPGPSMPPVRGVTRSGSMLPLRARTVTPLPIVRERRSGPRPSIGDGSMTGPVSGPGEPRSEPARMSIAPAGSRPMTGPIGPSIQAPVGRTLTGPITAPITGPISLSPAGSRPMTGPIDRPRPSAPPVVPPFPRSLAVTKPLPVPARASIPITAPIPMADLEPHPLFPAASGDSDDMVTSNLQLDRLPLPGPGRGRAGDHAGKGRPAAPTTMRIRPLPWPEMSSTGATRAIEEAARSGGPRTAATVFAAGLAGLVAVLWWLL